MSGYDLPICMKHNTNFLLCVELDQDPHLYGTIPGIHHTAPLPWKDHWAFCTCNIDFCVNGLLVPIANRNPSTSFLWKGFHPSLLKTLDEMGPHHG